MARLPSPGGDNGNWGDILNDFLRQSHNESGSIKDGAVSGSSIASGAIGTSALSDGAITETKLADGSVVASKIANDAISTSDIQDSAITADKIADSTITSSKLASGVLSGSDGLRSLLIYYATPEIINARYSNDYSAGVLSRYSDVVLGDGLEVPTHPSYANTVAIIEKVADLDSGTVIWGYIDCGVNAPTANYSLAELQTFIDQWVAIGAGGIFCDVIGYDYGVTRARQNAIISYIHSKGVGAILNAWDPDDLFSSAVDPTYNPSGTATVANNSDVYLLESWVCNSDSYSDPYYATFSDVKTRGDAARVYRDSLGVRIFGSNIIEHNTRTEEQLDVYRGISEALARVWRLDGSGIAASGYSAVGDDTGIVLPRFYQCRANAVRQTAPYVLNGTWTEVEAPDLGILVHFEAGTHTWEQL